MLQGSGTSGWFSGLLPLLAWLASIMMAGVRPTRVARELAASTPAGIVVRRFSTAQDDVAIRIAGGRSDRRTTILGDRHEMVRLRRGQDRIDRDHSLDQAGK